MKENKAATNRRVLLVVTGVAVMLVGFPVVLSLLDKRTESQVTEAKEPVPAASTLNANPAKMKNPAALDTPTQIEAQEIHYLPKQVSLANGPENALLKKPNMKEGNRRLVGARKLTDKAKNGEFLAPKWSPDGLQMLATRPGYRGLFVVDAQTGDSRQIADGGAYGAKWTPDGKIEMRDDDGNIKTLNPDGTVDSVGADPKNQQAYAENDTVFVKAQDGRAVPITSSDDKYFNPVVSPDGKTVVYQGLTSGLYMASADGTGQPTYIGRGNNAVWSPDSSGIIFDVTTDDGHLLTSGDLYFVDANATERTNITPDTASIDEMPSVSADGREVVYQSDGEIYLGELR
ncbi:MAG: hypothetical protein ABI579_06690 [Candidatus Sumerlaeota bacterium]